MSACAVFHHALQERTNIMSKTILVLTGSPRVGGNSDQLAEAFIRGAQNAGNTVIRFDAGRKQIGPCVGCQGCFSKGTPCMVVDDFTEFALDLLKADAVAIFTPLYWFNWPGGIKAAIDKLFSFYCSGNQTRVRESIFVVCGESDQMDTYDPIIKTYEKTAELMHWENKGHIVVPSVFEAGAVQNTPAIAGMEKIGTYF